MAAVTSEEEAVGVIADVLAEHFPGADGGQSDVTSRAVAADVVDALVKARLLIKRTTYTAE